MQLVLLFKWSLRFKVVSHCFCLWQLLRHGKESSASTRSESWVLNAPFFSCCITEHLYKWKKRRHHLNIVFCYLKCFAKYYHLLNSLTCRLVKFKSTLACGRPGKIWTEFDDLRNSDRLWKRDRKWTWNASVNAWWSLLGRIGIELTRIGQRARSRPSWKS